MYDIVRYDNCEIRVPRGSNLRSVINVVTRSGKVERRILSVRKIPDLKTEIITWEIELSPKGK